MKSEHSRYVPHVKRYQKVQNQLEKHRLVKWCVEKRQKVKQKLIIIGDSHVRKYAAELQYNKGSTFAVSSFIKPGAGMKNIVNTMKEDIKMLKSDVVLIIWGGTNDLGNNSKEALRHLCTFIKNNRKVNIIVLTAPHLV